MSKYTTELRFICENTAGFTESQGVDKVQDVLAKCWNKVFNFDFPIYDEDYRAVLCKKILLHYYTREIAAETVGLWKMWLMARMNEIMPYYNKLYELAALKIDPIKDVNVTTSHTGSGTNKGTIDGHFNYAPDNKTVTTNKGTISDKANGGTRTIEGFSDTPIGNLNNVEGMNYLSSANQSLFSNNQGNTQTTDTTNTVVQTGGNISGESRDLSSTDEYVTIVTGKTAGSSHGKLIEEYRNSLQNVDMLVIRDLGDLFMTIW